MIYKLKNNYYLRFIKKSDLNKKYHSWFQDQFTTEFSSHGKFSKSIEFYSKQILNSIDNNNNLVLAICNGTKHIGNVSLSSMSFLNRSAEFSIIIGDKRNRERGVGFIVGKKVLQHGFEKLNLNRIYCGTSSKNEKMVKLAKKLGMRLEGRKKKAIYLKNKFEDQLDFAILKNEFFK